MILFRYWSFWNFNWYVSSELGLLPLNGPLKMSIINTSIFGALMTYIYPKRIILKENNKIIKGSKLKILDLIFNHIPLLRLYLSSQISNTCGLYSVIPVSMWIFYLNYFKINKNKIYLMKFNHVMYISLILSGIIGLNHHHPSLLYKLYM